MKKNILVSLFALTPVSALLAQTMESAFVNPDQEARPIMIWQWMDGVVSEAGITADLEAYKEAGLGGVQQFLVGGPLQTIIKDSTKAIGTEQWTMLMRHAIDECARLGLSFGTHNCPGWSSSASPQVAPEYSMQKLVYSVEKVVGNGRQNKMVRLAQPESYEGYYEDIAVLAVPDSDVVNHNDVVDVTAMMDDGALTWRAPKGAWRVYRIGHTSNGKTNEGTAPEGGRGLECDKMSRKAMDMYWSTYPQMVLDIAGDKAGTTFKRWEIDSYEAGGQEWTRDFPKEFAKRKQYDVVRFLPFIMGLVKSDEDEVKKARGDYNDTGTDLVAQNYYGYMSELAHKVEGMQLLVQPYATGASKPFNPVNTYKVANAIADDDLMCAEFWTRPNWGWPEVPRVVDAAAKTGHQRVFAEGFTSWPLHAWRDDPYELKRVADRAFCLGINSLMLHAGAQNPWQGYEPGMTFGMWGTQWTPNQTWWKSGGAKSLFEYMTHCQALLQRGELLDSHRSRRKSLSTETAALQWVHRKDGDRDIYFVSNTADTIVDAKLNFEMAGRVPELWNPMTLTRVQAKRWDTDGRSTTVAVNLQAGEACFIIMQNGEDIKAPGLAREEKQMLSQQTVDGPWVVSFPVDDEGSLEVKMDSLTPWNVMDQKDVRYFSGTARYATTLKVAHWDKKGIYTLNLGEVKNLARLWVNGKEVAHMWCPPYSADVTEYLRKGKNTIEVDVTNLWVNRMIGDEQEPDDIEWGEPHSVGFAPGNPVVGRFMKKVPSWLENGQPRPSSGRKTVVSFKYFNADDELLPSGILGPVTLNKY